MEGHASSFLLALLLFLANFLIIKADEETLKDHVTYFGHNNPRLGGPWHIGCENLLETDKVEWTRNGISLQNEIDNHSLSVVKNTSFSTIFSQAAAPSHSGSYKCTADSLQNHTLRVYGASDATQTKGPSVIPLKDATGGNEKSVFYVLPLNSTVTLPCETNSSGPIYWKLNNNNVTEDKKHYKLLDNGKRIVISNPVKSILGNYTCRLNVSSPNHLMLFQVIAMPTVRIDPPNWSVVEEEKLQLTCITPTHLGPQITWVFGNNTYTSTKDRVNLTKDESQGIENAVLTIKNISISDAGEVRCRVTFRNVVTDVEVETVTQFTVKGKLAALWPFLGICVEVIVLCAIILVYEKKRNKAELEESDTDQSPDTKPTPNKDSEVRQRK